MSFDFREDVSLYMPDYANTGLTEFEESEKTKTHGLIIEVASIHSGATANFNMYSSDELEKSINSWLEPYPKPVIMNHNKFSEPIGRIMGAKMDQEADGTPFVRLQAAILDPAAMQKVSDGRYLTGSVGGNADEAVCTICNTDWAKPKESRGLPCVHQRGKVYNGKVAMLDMKNIQFKEYSFVNMPADSGSSVRKIGVSGNESDNWIKPARFFVLDMDKENIVEFVEQEESRNVLEGLRKKDALPLYMGLKGAFIVAQAIYEDEMQENSSKDSVNMDKPDTNTDNEHNTVQENLMSDENSTENEQDILDVTGELSDDLAAAAVAEEVADADAEETDAVEESEEEAPEVSEEAEEVEEGERPEGQEKAHDKDPDPDNSDGADKSRESEEADAEVNEVEATEEEEVSESDAELNAEENDTEPHVEELEQEIATLTETNEKLQERVRKLEAALHKGLAERVVDAKISIGLITAESRNSEIEEHSNRTPQSLADSMRDLAKMDVRAGRPSVLGLEMDQTLDAVKEDNAPFVDENEVEEQEEKTDPLMIAENFFHDVFMGRKPA